MSTAHRVAKLYSAEEYLVRERAAQQRSEFFRGQIWAMAGANARHNLICASLAASCVPQLRPLGCKFFGSDMRTLVTGTEFYTYPDGAIACGELRYADERQDTLLNPCVLFEVLSPSTEARDRGWKFQRYWNIPSLTDYLLISQEQPLVEQFVRKSSDIWTFRRYLGLEAALELSAIACRIDLRSLYFDVTFGPEPDGPSEPPL